ncbi:Uncharacterised protein [Candidatus Burarchaeum australiense]|nr:Uncharacterised protein [Candidatus Burarchaeum australiense]
MKLLLASVLVFCLLAAGCSMLPSNRGPETPAGETVITPVQQTPTPQAPQFSLATLCGATYGNYSNKVIGVRPCGQGDYVIYRECCGEPVTYITDKGVEVAATAELQQLCMKAGDNICSSPNTTEIIACPSYEIANCPDYAYPVCGRIDNSSGEGWLDFATDCLACKEGKLMGGNVSYRIGDCASNGIQTRAEWENSMRENIYADMVGKEVQMYAQHYGMGGRIVTITVTKADIQQIDEVTYNGVPAWRVTIMREMEGIPRTIEIYYSEDGKQRLDTTATQDQTQ